MHFQTNSVASATKRHTLKSQGGERKFIDLKIKQPIKEEVKVVSTKLELENEMCNRPSFSTTVFVISILRNAF